MNLSVCTRNNWETKLHERCHFNDIVKKGHDYLAYTKTYEFGNAKVRRVFVDNNLKKAILPKHIQGFIDELINIGEEEKFGEFSIYNIDIEVDDKTRIPKVIVSGVLEEFSEERCENKWQEFKEMLLPVEQRGGVESASTTIRASYANGRPVTTTVDFNL